MSLNLILQVLGGLGIAVVIYKFFSMKKENRILKNEIDLREELHEVKENYRDFLRSDYDDRIRQADERVRKQIGPPDEDQEE